MERNGKKYRTYLGSQKPGPSANVKSVHQQIAFRLPCSVGVKFKTFLGVLLNRTGKEKPNKDCRRLWPLISLVSRNKVGPGKFPFVLL